MSDAGTKTLVIHAGTYKTGSSAIQLYLYRAARRNQLGADISYPETGRGIGVQHGNLIAELRGGNAYSPDRGSWDDLFAEINAGTATTTIVSSENFAALAPERIAVIGTKAAAAGVKVRWVHYLREQAGFYNAFYVERLVNMRPEFAELINLPFEEFGEWSPIDVDYLCRYASFADILTEAIPGVELCFRPFSRSALIDGDVVADFCATVGAPHVAGSAEDTNIGTGWRTVETARLLTPIVEQRRLRKRLERAPDWHAIRMRWIALIRSELVQVTNELGWNQESAIYLTPEFRATLLERYAEENRRIAEIAGFDWPAIIAAERPKPRNVGDFDEIRASELATVFDRVMHVVMQPPEEIEELLQRPGPRRASLPRRAVRYARRKLG